MNVPFGKYKGQPIEQLLADRDYLRWVLSQPSLVQMLHDRWPDIFNIITIGAPETDDTPEHNRLQALFLDPDFQAAVLNAVCGSHLTASDIHLQVSFEHRDGYDVRLLGIEDRMFGEEMRVEIKPHMGDDFPAVLRQVRRNTANVVLVGQFHAEGATLDQVRQMFGAVKIILLRELE